MARLSAEAGVPDAALLALLRANVEQGARHIRKQCDVIARLRALDADTDLAEAILITFEQAQARHCHHLAYVEQRDTKRAME
jgi:hypothetical protein